MHMHMHMHHYQHASKLQLVHMTSFRAPLTRLPRHAAA